MEQEMPRVNVARPRRRQTKAGPAPGGGGGSPPPLQNTWEEQIQMIILWPASQVKVVGVGDAGGQRRLAPARLNLPIFCSTDANADVTYEIWHFNVQGWLDQYDEASMRPHIFSSLQGYPGK